MSKVDAKIWYHAPYIARPRTTYMYMRDGWSLMPCYRWGSATLF